MFTVNHKLSTIGSWLAVVLALPYVVHVTTGPLPYCSTVTDPGIFVGCEEHEMGKEKVWITNPDGTFDPFFCEKDDHATCEQIYDRAEALNEAHQRRMHDNCTRRQAKDWHEGRWNTRPCSAVEGVE